MVQQVAARSEYQLQLDGCRCAGTYGRNQHPFRANVTLTARGAMQPLVRAGQYAPGCRFYAAVESPLHAGQVMLKGGVIQLTPQNGSGNAVMMRAGRAER